MLEEQINLPIKDQIYIERYMTGDGYVSISRRLNVSASLVKYYLNAKAMRDSAVRTKKHRVKRRLHRQKFLRRVLRKASCSICGFDDPISLEFDHVIPSEKEYPISHIISKAHNMETIKNEIRKCRIICANCHARHTHMQQNTYRWQAFGDIK